MRKSLQALCVAVTLGVALLVLAVAPALATNTHVFSGSIGEPGSGAGQLALESASHAGVAVNSVTHDVYVADSGNHRVDEFSAAGAFIRAWGWGVADGMAAFETCTLSCQAGVTGSGPGQFTIPSFIAVDNSGGPSEGDVYVADVRPRRQRESNVSKFSASGAYLSTNDGSAAIDGDAAGPFHEIGGIAVDGSGNLWVDMLGPGGKHPPAVFEFAQDGTFTTGWDPNRSLIPHGMAVDSFTNIYLSTPVGVNKYTSGGNQIGNVEGEALSPIGISGVAVDASTNDLYVDEESGQISHYAPSCDPAKGACTVADSFGLGNLSGADGLLAVDSTYGTVYAADAGNQRIAVFGGTPDLTTGQSSNRVPAGAVLSGTVNPRNTLVSDCHFDYVADAEYNPAEPNPYAAGLTAPCVPAPGAGNVPVAVHAEIAGLTPGVTYHFRLQASNANGTSFGSDQTVPGTPPVIASTLAVNVAATSADLRAQINPGGGETTYRFEYGTSTSYGTDAPVPDGDIGHETSDVAVSQHVQGLTASTVYHYRVLASNPLGTLAGPDRTFLTQPSGSSGGLDTCPNAAIRAEQHAGALPDCRAYEQVSPAEKNDGSTEAARWQASLDGTAFNFISTQAFADAQTGASIGFPYLASRTQGSWSTRSVLPPQAPGMAFPEPHIIASSLDLSKSILIDGGGGGGGSGQDEPLLVPGEPANTENLFLRDNSSNTYQLIDLTPPGVTPANPILLAASPDLSHIIFTENAQLTADSPPAGEYAHLYEWSDGAVHLLGILPNGTPVPASLTTIVPTIEQACSECAIDRHAVSEDGSRVYFQTTEGPFRTFGLYLRENGATTVQIDASRGPGPGGEGTFAIASSNGSEAFFTDGAAAGLTSDTVAGSGANLYRYEVGSGALRDLTPAANAEVQGVVGASNDGSYIYFVANGVLANGASPGSCNGQSSGGSCSLYLFHNGATTFIATLNGRDAGDWNVARSGELSGTGIVSPDGLHVAFQSSGRPTGFDNTDAHTGQPDTEVFLYDALSGQLSCASCNSSGAAPVGESIITSPPLGLGGQGDNIVNHLPRYLFDSGRLFFNSRDSLVPRDTNGKWDAYEYEPEGVGGCQQAGGCVALISSGAGREDSVFRDASLTGEDAFFTTTDRLVSQDTDSGQDFYDARVGGGIASQNSLSAAPCSGESCKPPASGQPAEQAPGSSSFSGPGNPSLGSLLPSHRKPLRRKHRAKKKHHRKPSKRAHHNRRGAK